MCNMGENIKKFFKSPYGGPMISLLVGAAGLGAGLSYMKSKQQRQIQESQQKIQKTTDPTLPKTTESQIEDSFDKFYEDFFMKNDPPFD